jgi:hypothetical protein
VRRVPQDRWTDIDIQVLDGWVYAAKGVPLDQRESGVIADSDPPGLMVRGIAFSSNSIFGGVVSAHGQAYSMCRRAVSC